MNKKRLPYILASILILILAIWGCLFVVNFVPENEIVSLDSGWTLQINDKKYENITMSSLYNSTNTKLSKNDHIVFTNTLPKLDVPNPVILFRSRYTTLKCYVDGKLIFDFGEDYYLRGKFLGKMYHVISLPRDYEGKEIILDMYAAEKNAFVNLDPPEFGAQPDITGKLVRDNIIIIATGLFMFLFGLIFLCIAMIFVNFVPEVMSLLFGSLLCMNLSAWLLTYYNILSLFIYTEAETEIEYFTMYLIVPYSFIIVYCISRQNGNRLFLSLMMICCSVPILQLVLHYVFNIHLRDTLNLYHVTGIIGFAMLLYYAILVIRKKVIVGTDVKIQLTGLLVFTISEVMHLAVFLTDKMNILTNQTFNKVGISLGCLIFAVCQLATYLVFITDSYARKQENISLSHLAYADGLTNIANRSKADKLMEELNSADDDYCILSIDLNGLKDINDKYGHPTGDKYIKEFAKVLSNTFGENDFCARIGGDEFLVIIRDANSKDVNTLIGRMNSALNVMNALYSEYKRSVSVGFAFRHEIKENNSHEVYLMADQRMYENKRLMHKELGIHTRL